MAGLSYADIVTERGLFYKDGGQGPKDLIKLLQQPSETEKYFPLTPTKSTIIEKATVQMTRVFQAFQVNFTPLGTMTFKPTSIPLQRGKIDSSLTPDDLQNNWLGFLAEKGLDKKQMPITKYYQEYLIAQAAEDIETHEVFGGVYVAPTEDESNDAGENLNGIRFHINAGVDDETITPITLGAMPTDAIECVEYIEAFVGNINGDNQKLKKHLDYIFCSEDIAERFAEGMDMKYNTNYQQVSQLLKVKRSHIAVVGLPSHNGSDKIWATPQWNRARYTKNGEQALVFDIQQQDRLVKFMNDHWRGLGFWVPQYIMTNDQDLNEE